jgi:hypothetical protein
MIGTRVERRADGDAFRVVGQYGSQLVLGPIDHGPSVAVSELELRTQFDIAKEPDAEAVQPQTRVFGRSAAEQAGREALAAAHVEALNAPRSPLPPSPEDVFAAESASRARRSRKTA